MKKQLTEQSRLIEKAMDLLDMAKGMQERLDTLLKYNVEVAEPNGFTPHSTDRIDTVRKGAQRLYTSYKLVIKQMNEI
jgi:hypothetical protein